MSRSHPSFHYLSTHPSFHTQQSDIRANPHRNCRRKLLLLHDEHEDAPRDAEWDRHDDLSHRHLNHRKTSKHSHRSTHNHRSNRRTKRTRNLRLSHRPRRRLLRYSRSCQNIRTRIHRSNRSHPRIPNPPYRLKRSQEFLPKTTKFAVSSCCSTSSKKFVPSFQGVNHRPARENLLSIEYPTDLMKQAGWVRFSDYTSQGILEKRLCGAKFGGLGVWRSNQ